MTKYLVRRLVYLVPTLLGVTLLAFTLLHLAPGDPARILAGNNADPATIEAIRTNLGLDQPLPVQFVGYLGKLVRGDLGQSYVTRTAVSDEVARRYPRTFTLAITSILIALVLGIALGVLASVKPYSLADNGSMLVALTAISVPNYAFALVLIYVFAVRLRLLPTVGLEHAENVILPALSLAFYPMAYVARLTRAGMLDVLGHDYIRTARAKGLDERLVFIRHALRNALMPVATAVGLSFGYSLGGAVIAESIFAINGIGKMMLDGIVARDMPMVIAAMLVITGNFVAVNLGLDILNGVIDPRVRR